jgi:type I restriction enzyme S subunit
MSTRKAIDPSTTSEHAQYETYKGTEDDWLGKIPAHWETARVQHVADVYPSSVDKRSSEDEQPVRLCNYTDVYYGTRINDASEFMEATATEPEIQTHELRSGDVLVTKDSEARDDIAVPALVTRDMPGVLCGYHLAQLRPTNRIHGSFLYYAFKTPSISTQFEAAATGITRYGLSVGALKKARLYLPPLPEQRAIAAYLDRETERIDTLIDKKERLIDLLEEKRTALISHAVTKGLDDDVAMQDSGVEWLGEIPAHWTNARLKFVARLETGHTPSRSKDKYWEECTIPWVTLSDVGKLRSGRLDYIRETKEKISELGLENSSARLLPEGTVILSRTASVGFAAILENPMATTQDFANWICGDDLLPKYLLHCFRGMRHEFDRLIEGSTHKTIYMPDIERFRIPLPPLSEQRAIAAYLDRETERIDTLIDTIQDAIDRLKEYRTALISAAVTGQIDVRGEAEGLDNLQ